jgi:hypothetical protein
MYMTEKHAMRGIRGVDIRSRTTALGPIDPDSE